MRRPLSATFTMPLMLCALTIAGLILGVARDGWTDWLAIAMTALPALVVGRHVLRSS